MFAVDKAAFNTIGISAVHAVPHAQKQIIVSELYIISNPPFFSIVIPVHNRPQSLLRAILSVTRQKFGDYEIIISDDGSTKNPLPLLETNFPASDFIFIRSENNKGVSHARNLGIEAAKGKWICFLDSDDEWDAEKLSRQKKFIEENPDKRICQTEEIWIRKNRKVNPGFKHIKKEGDIFAACLELCMITPSSVAIKSDLLKKEFRFDERLQACEDYDLWLRLSSVFKIGLIREQLLIRYGGHDDQLSCRFPVMDRFRIYAMLKLLRQFPLQTQQKEQTIKALKKKTQIMLDGCLKRGTVFPKGVEDMLRKVSKGDLTFLRHERLNNFLLNHSNFTRK